MVIPKEIRRTMRIREGDPLEIYTSREGEVIFKKYSLLGGVEDFAAELCETMSRSTGSVCAVTDRDTVIAVAGGSKRELMGKRITPELEQIMESRKIYQYTGEGQPLQVTEGIDSLLTTVAAPILAEGDLLGLVLFISSDPAAVTGDTEYKLAQTIAAFLGKHMESLGTGVRVFDGMKCRKDAMLEVSPNSEGAASMTVSEWIAYVDQRVWGPGMLVLLMGTGVFLTLRTRFLPWRNLGWALKSVLGRDSRAKAGGAGDVSPFSALMTTLAATIGTGNIVGVATALVAGGPGALVWMEISALFGLSSKCAECLLAVKYRQRDAGGEMRGGPMYTMCAALRWKRLGGALAFLFALFTVLASLGMGDMAQANSIAGALADSFSVPARTTGVAVALLALVVILGGIRRIAGVCSVVVPLMAVLYLLAGTAVLLGHLSALPGAVAEMFRLAFSPAAAAGGAAGTMTASALNAARWGIARGCFSHEAGMGSAAIPAASAATDSPARQGYVNMTGVFFDTTVICTVTGLCICASGVLGTADASGGQVNGVALTALAFKTVLGPLGGLLVSLGIVLFAFSTILGWEFCGETAFAFLFGRRAIPLYRILFALAAFLGATQSLEVVWNLSDIFNALMAVPNLISLLLLSGTAARELEAFQPEIRRGRRLRQRRAVRRAL